MPRRPHSRGCGADGLGHLYHSDGAALTASEDRGAERLQVRFTRRRRVERLEPSGGVEEQGRGIAAALSGERDLSPKALEARVLERVERRELGRREQRVRDLGCARVELGLGCGDRSRSPSSGVGSQLGRSFQERGRGRNASATLRPVGRAFQLTSHRLVETARRVGTMPCSTVGIRVRICFLGQRVMYLLPFGQHSCPIDRRTDEGMSETHARADLDQPGGLGWPDRRRADSESLARAPEQCDVAERLRRRQQKQPL
jgi:hypothetical protein